MPTTPSKVDYTGRQLVLMRETAGESTLRAISSASGARSMARASDYKLSAINSAEAASAPAFLLDELKVVIVNADPDRTAAVSALASTDSGVLATEPERMNYHCSLIGSNPVARSTHAGAGYLRGYRDAVNHLAERLLSEESPLAEAAVAAAAQFNDNAQFTWGLQATRVNTSHFSGQGIRVAVLDTGLDFQHPDFQGRVIQQQSFVQGETAADGYGHGTHTAGTACGHLVAAPPPPSIPLRRYGCGFGTELFIGKVLSNQGSGPDQGILGGINWAIVNNCRIVSMSFGAPVQPGDPPSPIYEQVASRALDRNTLIIAAAGNSSQRPAVISPVCRPANCPSVMAVAALDSSLNVAPFSCGGINPNGGGVDIAGPGVNVFSSWPMPQRYNSISGTSMATPHVSGIAALWLEARPNLSARELWQVLVSNAYRLSLPARDVGAGLVLAPQ
jgi:subtilisin family serine protease